MIKKLKIRTCALFLTGTIALSSLALTGCTTVKKDNSSTYKTMKITDANTNMEEGYIVLEKNTKTNEYTKLIEVYSSLEEAQTITYKHNNQESKNQGGKKDSPYISAIILALAVTSACTFEIKSEKARKKTRK